MAQYRSYMVDENSHEKDEITLEIVSFEEGRTRNMVCRACDGDVEVGFTLHENARTHATEFVSDGEVTENFVRLLAKLFGKDFPVKKTGENRAALPNAFRSVFSGTVQKTSVCVCRRE